MRFERPCSGEWGFCLDEVRLAGLRPLRQVSPLRDSRSGCPYPGLTPWAITISPLCGLGIFEVVSLLEGGALASPIRMVRDAGAEFEC